MKNYIGLMFLASSILLAGCATTNAPILGQGGYNPTIDPGTNYIYRSPARVPVEGMHVGRR
ncbi:MAG: hypothetical protein WAW86_07855 [Gammaproteobacteria bacterium]